MKKRFYFTGALLLLSMLLQGYGWPKNQGWQTLSVEEYDKLTARAENYFSTTQSYALDYSLASYKTHTDKVAFETEHGFVRRSGNNFHSYLLGIHTIQNAKYRFTIDSAYRTVVISEPLKDIDFSFIEAERKALRGSIVSIQKKEEGKGQKIQVTFDKKSRVSTMEMFFSSTGFLEKSISYMRVELSENPTDPNAPKSAPRIEMNYLNYRSGLRFDYKKEFDEKPYFEESGGAFLPGARCKGFTVHDTRIVRK